MQMTVGVGRPVVEDKRRPALGRSQLFLNAVAFLIGENLRLALGQAGPHRKVGFGKNTVDL